MIPYIPIKASRARVRWRDGAAKGDEWVITRLKFFDKNGRQILPKKALSTGSRQNFTGHDDVVFGRQDGYAYNYGPLDWKGQCHDGHIFIGGIFARNVDIRSVHITQEHDPISRTGQPISICIEYWDGRCWHEYPEGVVSLKNIYEISYFEERKIRDGNDFKAALLASCFDPYAPLTDSNVIYLVDRDLIDTCNLWRLTCEENEHWAWDVKSIRFIGLDNAFIRPLRVFSSGQFDPQYSANQAFYNMGNIWAGHKDSSRIFYIGCEFEDDILPSHVEITQPYSLNLRNELYVEYFDTIVDDWVRVARYSFHKHFIKRGPIALPIIKRYELSVIDCVASAVPFGESSICDDKS